LRVVTSLLGLRLERHNPLFLRHSATILLDGRNPICHQTYQCEFGLEELDKLTCCDAYACDQLCKQFCKAPGLTYQLANYKPGHSDDNDYGLLLDTDVVANAISSHSEVYCFKFSTVSSNFDLRSLGDTLSRIHLHKLNDTYFMNASSTFPVP
jgi:hypothetical protein